MQANCQIQSVSAILTKLLLCELFFSMSAQNFPPNFDTSMTEILRNDAIISQNLDEWKFFISYLGKQNKNVMLFMNEYHNFVHMVTIRCLKTKITEK